MMILNQIRIMNLFLVLLLVDFKIVKLIRKSKGIHGLMIFWRIKGASLQNIYFDLDS
jgi:hypothetical protein